MPLRIAALVKQIPAFEEMELGADGRLVRAGLDLEMNAYCRRAVAQAVALAAAHGGDVTFITLGPPEAHDVLREAITWAQERSVAARGLLVSDRAFAGSDTLATAKALEAVLRREGRFDLVFLGRNSVDADTGQVGPELAELLDLPFATAARHLSLDPGSGDAGPALDVRCEHDDGWVQLHVRLPAMVSCAERLIDPCKVPPQERALVDAALVETLTAADLGPGPWGAAASPTSVGRTRVHDVPRRRRIIDGSVDSVAREVARELVTRGALTPTDTPTLAALPPSPGPGHGAAVMVVVEPHREALTSELLGCAAGLASQVDGHVVAIGTDVASDLGALGADLVIDVDTGETPVEEDIARGVAQWTEHAVERGTPPWAILAPSTAWGREVASRVAARLDAGLTGDAIALEVARGRLVAWKPAFGGQLVAEILTSSPTQLATVRSGVLDATQPRSDAHPPVERLTVEPRGRVTVLARTRDDDLDVLADAQAVVGVGQAIRPDEYPLLDPLLHVLDAQLAATRKVTDLGWLPRARQLGITGRSIAPRLYVALGLGGKFNHMVGVRSAGTILAVNTDPDSPVFGVCDLGVVAPWKEFVPALVTALRHPTTST